MSLYRFFLFFLLSSLLIYFFLKPYVIDQQTLKNIPLLEFDSFITYEIEAEKLKVMIIGDKAKRYPSRLEFKDFSLYREANHTVQTISALEGVIKGDIVNFANNVHYQEDENMTLETEKAKYNLKDETLEILTPFVLWYNDSVIKGSSLFFNQKDDKIRAKDVNASLIMK